MTTERDKTAELQQIGKNAYECIAEMVAALECDYDRLEELRELWADANQTIGEDFSENDAEELKELEGAAGECKSQDDAAQRIQEDPLSVRIFGERVDGDWQADKFEILLSTGGPATRIMGELDGNNEPSRAWIEAQDWFQPWADYVGGDMDTILTYCRQFCFE